MNKHKLEIGAHVIYITPQRERVNALVEVIHAAPSGPQPDEHGHWNRMSVDEHLAKYGQLPCINVLYLSPDPDKKDQQGRQKERATSVCHGSQQGVPQGYCWLWPDEVEKLDA